MELGMVTTHVAGVRGRWNLEWGQLRLRGGYWCWNLGWGQLKLQAAMGDGAAGQGATTHSDTDSQLSDQHVASNLAAGQLEAKTTEKQHPIQHTSVVSILAAGQRATTRSDTESKCYDHMWLQTSPPAS